MSAFFESVALLFVLLNPFLVIVYLADVVEKKRADQFRQIVFRATVISCITFCVFAIVGDTVFSKIVHVEFASFQIFGGIVFLLIGLQFVFHGPRAITILRGESEPEHLAGAIAMPVLIGPGTISASVVIGEKLTPITGCLAVVLACAASTSIIIALKKLHDYVRPRNEPIIQRYIEVAGRITALFVGTVSVEMIMQGLWSWIDKF